MRTKVLIAAICVAVFACMLSVFVSAEGFVAGSDAVYFVNGESGADTNAGTSAAAPFQTVYQAYSALRESGGTVVVCGEAAIDGASVLPAGGAVVFTSVYKGADYRATGASLLLSEDLAFENDTYFENLTLTLLASDLAICGRANNLGFGNGILSVDASGAESFRYPTVIGGWNCPSSPDATSNAKDYTVYIFSGKWQSVFGANRRLQATDCISDFGGDVALVIRGGEFADYVSATGMNVHSGRVYLEISGGTFFSAVVPIRRLGTMPQNPADKTAAEFDANLLVRISGGTFHGRFRLAENQVSTTGVTYVPKGDATVVVTGGTFHSDLVGYGVIGSVLLKYKDGVIAEEKIKGFPARKTGSQTVSETPTEYSRFTNPIGDKADPYVVEKDGIYYYCFSSSVTLDGTAYAAVKIAAHGGIGFGELTTQHRSVFNSTQTSIANAKKEYWAPELHYFDADTVGAENAGWYIYFAADDGNNNNHRMYVLRATDPENPFSDFAMVGQITDSTNKWAIDGTVLQLNGSLYFVWSGWEGNTNVAQNIYIAKMSNPWTVSGERVLLSKPEYSWEKQGSPDVNEGPQILQNGGTTHIVYSASGSWDRYYCYGVLTLTGTDPLDASHWYKATSAQFSSGNGVYGTGHGSFVRDDGGNWWMYYHANASLSVPSGSTWWAERNVYVKQFTFTETTLNGVSVSYPSFGTPAKHGSTQYIYARTADYHADGAHQYSAYTLGEGEEAYVATRTCHICGEAESVEIPWLVPTVGDFNGDNAVTVSDVLFLITAVLNGTFVEDGDLNGDGVMSLRDVLFVMRQAIQ